MLITSTCCWCDLSISAFTLLFLNIIYLEYICFLETNNQASWRCVFKKSMKLLCIYSFNNHLSSASYGHLYVGNTVGNKISKNPFLWELDILLGPKKTVTSFETCKGHFCSLPSPLLCPHGWELTDMFPTKDVLLSKYTSSSGLLEAQS